MKSTDGAELDWRKIIDVEPDVCGPIDAFEPGMPDSFDWLDLRKNVAVEVSSEDPLFPIDSALSWSDGPGWRAAAPGEQVIRLIFFVPQTIHRIQLRFSETAVARTQEFGIWHQVGRAFKEIACGRWSFNPPHSTVRVEDIRLKPTDISLLELAINPDVSHGKAVATLDRIRIG